MIEQCFNELEKKNISRKEQKNVKYHEKQEKNE